MKTTNNEDVLNNEDYLKNEDDLNRNKPRVITLDLSLVKLPTPSPIYPSNPSKLTYGLLRTFPGGGGSRSGNTAQHSWDLSLVIDRLGPSPKCKA